MNPLDIKTDNMFSKPVTLKTGLSSVLGSVNGSVKFFKYADDTMNQPWEQMTKEMKN